jgi:hypothetical protein
MAMERATNTVTNPGNVSVSGNSPIRQLPDPTPAPSTGQDLVNQFRGKGYHKGTSNVQPTRATGSSFRGDKNGSLTAAEHAGVSHPVLAQFNKK